MTEPRIGTATHGKRTGTTQGQIQQAQMLVYDRVHEEGSSGPREPRKRGTSGSGVVETGWHHGAPRAHEAIGHWGICQAVAEAQGTGATGEGSVVADAASRQGGEAEQRDDIQ